MTNKDKTPPKGAVRFSISLSDEQKKAKTEILKHPFNFIVGKAGHYLQCRWQWIKYSNVNTIRL